MRSRGEANPAEYIITIFSLSPFFFTKGDTFLSNIRFHYLSCKYSYHVLYPVRKMRTCVG